MNTIKIHGIKTSVLDDGAVEFCIEVIGQFKKAEISYGDGTNEHLEVPTGEYNPRLFSAHRFPTGTHRVSVILYDDAHHVVEKKKMAWTQ